ncbi:MAG TPA: hypothetical protein VG826_31990 [Pirellulales bacterium]|nr:hypothetical protein [Pirellulales bacterium]
MSDPTDLDLTGRFRDGTLDEAEGSSQPNELTVETRGRKQPLTPHARDFDVLAIILKFVGGCTTLTALLFLLAGGQIAAIALAAGILLVATGYGLAAYKTWAWYSAVAIMPVLVVVFSIASLVEAATNRFWFYFVGFPFAFSFYVAWVLFSKGGRARYRAAGEAIANAKANPDSVAGQLYRRRRR